MTRHGDRLEATGEEAMEVARLVAAGVPYRQAVQRVEEERRLQRPAGERVAVAQSLFGESGA